VEQKKNGRKWRRSAEVVIFALLFLFFALILWPL
jgi:hypothetical protein